MNGNSTLDLDNARTQSKKIQEQINNAIKQKRSFIVEAGPGTGKTYSLLELVDWLGTYGSSHFKSSKQSIVCITYTNAAVDVILSRLSQNSIIVPSTIHSFAWKSISQFQKDLIKVAYKLNLHQENNITKVEYTLGYKKIENGVLFLHHDDVIKMFAELLDNEKFRRVFTSLFPIVLIDEYQDSSKLIIDKFVEHFISKHEGPIFGFFGDSWQNIYSRSSSCGQINCDQLVLIEKKINFRSSPNIIDFLNKIRPNLPQIGLELNFPGEVKMITCDDNRKGRISKGYYKGDLSDEEFKERVKTLKKLIQNKFPEESFKVLMITHKRLALHQDYLRLLNLLGTDVTRESDPLVDFFKDTIEPIFKGLKENNLSLLFQALGVRSYPICKKVDKNKWQDLYYELERARQGTCRDVLQEVVKSELIPIPESIQSLLSPENGSDVYKSQNGKRITVREVLALNYKEFLSLISFMLPDSIFSTDHGVKGEEYDNVLFVISTGWTKYNLWTHLPKIVDGSNEFLEEDYILNRNLFYVCCSRARKRLFVLVTVELDRQQAEAFKELFEVQNIFSYEKFVQQFSA